jgi:PAS domain-containing protein
VEIALLDRDGVIVAVNGAWDSFCAANGGEPERAGIGLSYLDVCAASAGDSSADHVAEAIRTALQGDLPAPMLVEVPCHSSSLSRWFDTLVSSRLDDDGRCLGATVTLSLALATPRPTRPASRGGRPTAPVPGATGDTEAVARMDRRPPVGAGTAHPHERLGDGFAQVVLELAQTGILVVGDDGIILSASRCAGQMFGYGRDGLVGASVERLLPGWVTPPGTVPLAGPAPGSPTAGGDRRTTRLGVRADGSPLRLQVESGPLPLSRGSGTVIVTAEVQEEGAVTQSVRLAQLEAQAHRIAEDLDRVVRRLFACGLTVAGIRGRHPPDGDVGTGLRLVADALDDAVKEIRTAVFRHGSN